MNYDTKTKHTHAHTPPPPPPMTTSQPMKEFRQEVPTNEKTDRSVNKALKQFSKIFTNMVIVSNRQKGGGKEISEHHRKKNSSTLSVIKEK